MFPSIDLLSVYPSTYSLITESISLIKSINLSLTRWNGDQPRRGEDEPPRQPGRQARRPGLRQGVHRPRRHLTPNEPTPKQYIFIRTM